MSSRTGAPTRHRYRWPRSRGLLRTFRQKLRLRTRSRTTPLPRLQQTPTRQPTLSRIPLFLRGLRLHLSPLRTPRFTLSPTLSLHRRLSPTPLPCLNQRPSWLRSIFRTARRCEQQVPRRSCRASLATARILIETATGSAATPRFHRPGHAPRVGRQTSGSWAAGQQEVRRPLMGVRRLPESRHRAHGHPLSRVPVLA